MPQVFNANSFKKNCFDNNFHEIPSNHSFHMCHDELNFSSYKYQGLGEIMSTQLMPPAMGKILCYVAITSLKFY